MRRAKIQLWLGIGGVMMMLVALGMAGHRAPFLLTIGLAWAGLLCTLLVLVLIPTNKNK